MVKVNRFIRLAAAIGAAAAISALVVSQPFAQKKNKQPVSSSSTDTRSTETKSPVLIKTSKESVTLADFEKAYKRMNDKDPYATSLDSLKDFLVIYGDYRLKLLDAKAQGLEKDPKIIKEMEGYRHLLAGPFVIDKMLTEPQVERLYERRKYEVLAAHFLASVHNWSDPSDTLKAYKRAAEAIKRLKAGEPMGMIVLSDREKTFMDNPAQARRIESQKQMQKTANDSSEWKGSDDPTSVPNGGSLGWFTAGMTIRPFEEAVYQLEPGSFSQLPVRTKFGYHVIYLIDKRLRNGGIKVHHILVAMNKSVKGPDTTRFYHKADSLLKAIRAGAKFEEVAKMSSDDNGSADLGGNLGAIDHETHRAEAAFDDAIWAMKDGEISGIVRTGKGYHIIRRDGMLPPHSFDQDKEVLKKVYKNYYLNEDKDKLLAVVRRKNNVNIDSGNINVFMSRIDSSRTSVDTGWAKRFTAGERNLAIYTFGGNVYNIATLADSLTAQPGYPLARNQIYDFINKSIESKSIDFLAADISARYPEFDQIMADYQNGIMLFELENRRVWSKVKPDSTGEIKFYAEHISRFMWPERIDVSEIYTLSDSLSNALYKRIRDKGENFDTLAAHYTERPGFKEKAGHWGLMTKDENEMAKKAFALTADDVSQPFNNQAGLSIVKVNKRVPITQKTFAESRQEVASQYQDEMSNDLRQKWVDELRKKYHREIITAPLEASYKEQHGMSSTK
ncbi:MAG TPA: peptidylprolyl isomerase [Candidatus Kapabacteria bacterium]|nr:peptidylprolyl isomerase [Candidatus Kapabacteria bacterium]